MQSSSPRASSQKVFLEGAQHVGCWKAWSWTSNALNKEYEIGASNDSLNTDLNVELIPGQNGHSCGSEPEPVINSCPSNYSHPEHQWPLDELSL